MATVDADRSLTLQVLNLAAGIFRRNSLIRLKKVIRNNHLSRSQCTRLEYRHAGAPAMEGISQAFPRLMPDRHLPGGVGSGAHLLPSDQSEHRQSTPPAARRCGHWRDR